MKFTRSIRLMLLLGYILGVHKGYLALWQDGNTEPMKVFPIRAEMLPQEDQRYLVSGIKISDNAELHDLLEDYLS